MFKTTNSRARVLAYTDIKNRYSAEAALIILLVRLFFQKSVKPEVDEFLSQNTIDWKTFYKLVRAHELRPFIYKIASEYALSLEYELLQRLRAESLLVAASNFERLNEMMSMQATLEKSGFEVVAYKGIMLSHRLFGDYITRETSDIDFLIQAKDFPGIREVFLEQGYKTDYYYDKAYEDVILDTGCEYMFYKQVGNTLIKIELHWTVIHSMQDVPVKNEYFFDHTITAQVSARSVKLLNIEAELLALLIHHGVNDIWRSLKHVLDVAAFVNRYGTEMDWEQVRAAAEKYKIRNAAQVGLALANELFGTAISRMPHADNKVVNATVHKLLSFPLVTKHKLYLTNFSQQLRLRDNFRDKMRLFAKYLLAGIRPNVRDIEAFRLPRKWFFLYYLIKPFRRLKSSQGIEIQRV